MSRIFIFVIASMLIASTLALPGILDPKPGICPEPSGIGLCADTCGGDLGCPGILKCCRNPCGALACADPIFPPVVIEPQD